jgi:hypothetical protein
VLYSQYYTLPAKNASWMPQDGESKGNVTKQARQKQKPPEGGF